MIDIETWGRQPNGLVVSIGAAFFDLKHQGIDLSFQTNIDPVDAQKVGMYIDAATIDWWFEQDAGALSAFRADRGTMRSAFLALAAFIPGDAQVWARGPGFDLNILRAGFQLLDIECPWKFWNERCHRTFLEDMYRLGVNTDKVDGGLTAHAALDDCIIQVRTMQAAWRNLREKMRCSASV